MADMPPLPDPDDPRFAGHWAAAAEGRLAVSRCAACAAWRWPPRSLCPACGAETVAWMPLPGTGTLYSWTVVHRAALPGFVGHVPYAVAIVALDDAPVRHLGRVVGASPDALRIGMPMIVDFEIEGGISLPVWRPASQRD